MRFVDGTILIVFVVSLLTLSQGCGGPDCAAPEYGTCVRDSEHHGARDLRFLSWLEGDWESEDTGGRLHSVRWLPGTGGVMLGYSRSHHGDRDLGSTLMRIEYRRESITLSAHEGGAVPGVPFALNDVDLARAGEARFENTEIDFPTRIIFRRTGDDTFLARLENDERGFTRTYARVEREDEAPEEE